MKKLLVYGILLTISSALGTGQPVDHIVLDEQGKNIQLSENQSEMARDSDQLLCKYFDFIATQPIDINEVEQFKIAFLEHQISYDDVLNHALSNLEPLISGNIEAKELYNAIANIKKRSAFADITVFDRLIVHDQSLFYAPVSINGAQLSANQPALSVTGTTLLSTLLINKLGNAYGVIPSSPTQYVVINANGMLGSVSGGGSCSCSPLTILCDGSTSATETNNTITFTGTNAGGTVTFNGSGSTVTLQVTDSGSNTAIGQGAAALGGFSTALGYGSIASGESSVALGYQSTASSSSSTALGYGSTASLAGTTATGSFSMAVGAFSTAIGSDSAAEGESSVAIGEGTVALGEYSVAIGSDAAADYQASIIIGTGCSDVPLTTSPAIVIGIVAGGGSLVRQCYIGGIYGSGSPAGGIEVLINSNGHLGTTTSSARYKENIIPMKSTTNNLRAMNPVEFTYKSDYTHQKQYGLIAEEIANIDPSLVLCNKHGSPETVYYRFLSLLLLKGWQEQQQQIDALCKRCLALEEIAKKNN